MTWREFWQTAVANLRALVGVPPARRHEGPAPSPNRVCLAPRDLLGPTPAHAWALQAMPTLDAAAPDPEPPPVVESSSPTPSVGDPPRPDPDAELLALLESLLFVAAEPVDPAQLARALAIDVAAVAALLSRLDAALRAPGRGLRLQHFDGKVQLVTAPAAASAIERFLNLDVTARLSGPALETLAVIAYRQPVTRAQIEAVRGVDCAGVLRSLTQRGLIAEVGRLETVGRPILYGVTELFMQHFGLLALDDLPPLEDPDVARLHAATQVDDPDTTLERER